jgi:hypothetical protein
MVHCLPALAVTHDQRGAHTEDDLHCVEEADQDGDPTSTRCNEDKAVRFGSSGFSFPLQLNQLKVLIRPRFRLSGASVSRSSLGKN